jgi:ostA family protein
MNRNSNVSAALLMLVMMFPATSVFAAYKANSNTGIEALDYIENNHRTERENRLTDEQKELLKAAEDMKEHLRYPWDPSDTTKPAPLAFEGDDLTYDQRNGDFKSKGEVHILQADAHSYDGQDTSGNLETHDLYFPEHSRILQMTPGMSHVILDGYEARYNYMTKIGTMESATGRVDRYNITGKRFEFYPDHYVAYDGTATKCSAIKPDYHWSAEKLTMYPGDKIVMENMKLHIKGKTIYSRKHYVVDLKDDGGNRKLPRVGYDSDDGAWISYKIRRPLLKNVNLNLNLLWMTRAHWRSNYNITWSNRHMSTGVIYGHFKDGDDNWVKKEPSFVWSYGDQVGKLPLTYSLHAERGRWYNKGIHSMHTEYGVTLTPFPLYWKGYHLNTSIGYNVVREGYDHSVQNGLNFDAVVTKDFNARWSAYAGYHYSAVTQDNSLFDYETSDYHRRFEGGFSYRISDHDRIAIGTRYNLDDGELSDVDYYWFHDMHCLQAIVRYRSKQDQWSVKLEFTPW